MSQSPKGKDPPEVLLAQARQGDRSALNALLVLYRNYLHFLASAQIKTVLKLELSASDVVQEILLDAFSAFEQFRGTTESEFMAWLRKILDHNLADQGRYHTAEKRDVRRRRPLAASVSSPSKQAVRREEAVLAANALYQLPERYRDVIIMRHFDRLPFKEIAAHMGRTSGAVRKLWARALEKLQRVMKEIP